MSHAKGMMFKETNWNWWIAPNEHTRNTISSNVDFSRRSLAINLHLPSKFERTIYSLANYLIDTKIPCPRISTFVVLSIFVAKVLPRQILYLARLDVFKSSIYSLLRLYSSQSTSSRFFLLQILPHSIMNAIPSFSNCSRPYLAHIVVLLFAIPFCVDLNALFRPRVALSLWHFPRLLPSTSRSPLDSQDYNEKIDR